MLSKKYDYHLCKMVCRNCEEDNFVSFFRILPSVKWFCSKCGGVL